MKKLIGVLIVGLALAAVAQVTHKNTGGFVFTDDVSGIPGTTDGSFVTRAQLYNLLEQFSVLSLFGATNAHPDADLVGIASMEDAVPAAWQTATVINADGTNLVGVFAYTNATDVVRAGNYVGRFYMAKPSGNRSITAYFDIVTLAVDGTATNVLATSSTSGNVGTALTSYRVTAHVQTNVTANVYLGVMFRLVSTSGANATTVNLYGGAGYDTHLETPGLNAL